MSLNLEFGAFEPPRAGGLESMNHGLIAFSLPPVGLAYYRQGVFASGPPEAAVQDVQSREQVQSRVHALTTSTFAVSLLQSVNDNIVLSATPKAVWGGDSVEADVDASVMLAFKWLRLGLVGRNLASPSFNLGEPGSEEVELDREVRVGGGWGSGWPGHSRVVVAVDGDVMSRQTPTGERRDVAAGVETWWFARRLGVRGGVRGSTMGETRSSVSAGASALLAGFYVEGFFASGEAEDRSWGLGLRYSF